MSSLFKPKPVKMMTPEQKALAAENLTDARAILADEAAWIKGALRKKREGGMSYCAIGAINKADGPAPRTSSAKRVLAAAIKVLHPRRAAGYSWAEGVVINFNDMKVTKHDQLLAAFDKAIELAQSDTEIPAIKIR